ACTCSRLPSPPPPDLPTLRFYTLSLPDALPIFGPPRHPGERPAHREEDEEDQGADMRDGLLCGHLRTGARAHRRTLRGGRVEGRSEEHTSELQSRENLACRLLLERKKQ